MRLKVLLNPDFQLWDNWYSSVAFAFGAHEGNQVVTHSLWPQ